MQYFFSSFIDNLKKSFIHFYGIPHVLAVVTTCFFVFSNFDWFYFTHMQGGVLRKIFFPAIILGGILPIIVPTTLILIGYIFRRYTELRLGWALAQAMVLGSFISSTYKAFTGRIQPNHQDVITNISNSFNFGFFEHGIFWGWPSSHTTIAFAMAVTLSKLFPTNKKVHLLAALYAFYVGIGVSFSIHWFSDFIAGAFIGTVIGFSVGRSFRLYFPSVKQS